jgi:Amidohydrolase family
MKAFLNAMITDGRGEGLSASTSSILVDDSGRIEAVGTGDLAVPEGYEVLDCRGHTVYPGLIDMHTHLNEASLGLFVDHGVTTVRDVGNDLQTVLGLRATTSDGTARGPRIHCAGPLLDGDPPIFPATSLSVEDEAGITAAVKYLVGAGVDGIKLYMGISPAQLAAAVDAAHAAEVPITAHLGATSCLEAAQAGVDSLEHAPQALYSSIVSPDQVLEWDKRRSLGQSRFWAQFLRGWALVDPDAGRTADVLGTLLEHKVALDPTLVVFQRMVDWATDPDSLRGLADQVDPTISERWVSAAEWFVADWSADDLQVARDALEVVKAVVARFAGLGGTFVVGTDVPFTFLVPGASLHQEMELLVEAGLAPARVLRAATADAARYLGWADDVGAIAAGRFADFVVCSGRPLEDIRDLAQITAVYQGGTNVWSLPD